MSRQRPNLLVTGTPGVGKTSFAQVLAQDTDATHWEVARLVTEHELYREWDDELNCSVFDEDLVLDKLEELLPAEGGLVVDFHSADFFPESWFDVVVVLRADTAVLFDRLEKRGYTQRKIQENVECEIFQVLLDEAKEAFEGVPVLSLENNSMEEMQSNLEQVKQQLSAVVLP